MAGGREVPDRRTDFAAGRIGCAGGAGARSKRQPGILLAPAVSPGAAESEERRATPFPRQESTLYWLPRSTWGAPRIHGELLKLGIDIGESSVSRYVVRCRKPPSQTWRTFLENHAKQLVSIDFFTVSTIRFQVLYVLLVLAHDRRRTLHSM